MYAQALSKSYKSHIKAFWLILLTIFGFFSISVGFAAPITPTTSRVLQVFPLENYDQNIDNWIKPSDPNYQKPLVDLAYQQKRMEEFYQHNFSSETDGLSPWSEAYVKEKMTNCPGYHALHKELLIKFNNEGKDANHIGHGVHFRPYDNSWIEKISNNINIEQFNQLQYKAHKRAIFVQNTYARSLPTEEPYYYHHTLPGEGYPFDQLQMSSIWAGTSAYILAESKDKNWSYVLTPDFACWVQSETLAKVNGPFIKHWQRAAKHKLAAITQTETAVVDTQDKNYHFKSYVGSIFPLSGEKADHFQILFPAKDTLGHATIRKAYIHKNNIAAMPLLATPENFVKLIKTLQNRPYGWGGLYHLNDCSSELKNLYAPFGFWLARHSADQPKAGKVVDKSSATVKEKIDYLKDESRPFMTFVYNTRHVFIYLGSFNNPNADNKITPLTYQNLWGLKPKDPYRRAIVGKALILPLLEVFPQDAELNSHANHKDFQVVYLDEWPEGQ